MRVELVVLLIVGVGLTVPETVRVTEGVRVNDALGLRVREFDGVSDHVLSGVPVIVGVCVTVLEADVVPVGVSDVEEPADDVLVTDPVLDDVRVRLARLGVVDEEAVGVGLLLCEGGAQIGVVPSSIRRIRLLK